MAAGRSQVDPAAMRQALGVISEHSVNIDGQRVKADSIVTGLQWIGPAGGATAALGAEWGMRTADIVRQLNLIRDKLTMTLSNYTTNDETQRARAVGITNSIGAQINL
ncbi:MAG TPA: hypothetical protein VMU51_05235 [Mycobacteriales bacterium]|nr:hypothetical protein [Mycobacteriales bacterium]